MIILIGGRAGEGKTTFANFCSKILEKQSVSSVTVPFARMVKETASFMIQTRRYVVSMKTDQRDVNTIPLSMMHEGGNV